MSFAFRALTLPEDGEVVRELFQLGFPEVRGSAAESLEHIGWKFGGSADAGLSLLGFEGDRPVAFYGVLPREYRIRGEPHVIGLVVDVMSHPEVRRRGLFVATGSAAMERLEGSDVEAVIGFPIRDDVMPGHLKVGWRADFELPVYVLPTGWKGTPGLEAPRWLWAFNAAAKAYRMASGPLRRRPQGTSAWLTAEEFAAHPVVQDLCSPVPRWSQLSKTPEFWRWRLSRPGADYHCVVAESGGSSAYAVVRELELRGVPSLAVLDLAGSAPGALRLVLSSLLDLARRRGCSTIAMCANPSLARHLRLGRSGFLRSPLRFTLIHRPTSAGPVDDWFAQEREWRLAWVDSDTV